MMRCPTICFFKAVILAVGYCVFAHGHIQAQTLGPDFQGAYKVRDIGIPNVAAFNGCILFKTNDPSVLLVGGQEEGQSEGIYQLKVQRDAQGHISGFSGAATLVAYAPGNPAAPFDIYGLYSTMDFGPDGVLFYPTFDGAIGQIKAGSSSPSRFIGSAN